MSQRKSRQEAVSAQLAILGEMPMAEIRALWAGTFDIPPPSPHRSVLAPLLAYRLQERAWGGLSRAVRAQLADIARDLAAGRTPALAPAPRLKPGTRLMRGWKGEVHEVTVVPGGFLYRQANYRSLSEIARLITGTRWSGPSFFGLYGEGIDRRRKAVRKEAA